MGRKRQTNKHLPPGVTHKFGSYYFIKQEKVDDKWKNKWIRLGKTLAEMAVAWANLKHIPDGPCSSMNALFDRYTKEVIPQKAEESQKSDRRAMSCLRAAFGDMHPKDITAVDIYSYQDVRSQVAKVRVNREKSLLSHVFTMAIRWGIVTDNPCKHVKRVREEPRTRRVDAQEFLAVRDWVPENESSVKYQYGIDFWKSLMNFAYYSGLRISDILRIRWADITHKGIVVKVGKTYKKVQKTHLYTWNEELRNFIDNMPKNGIHLFSKSNTQPYIGQEISSKWYLIMEEAISEKIVEERFQFRDIRPMSGKEAERKFGREGAMRFLAHKRLETTDLYIRGMVEIEGLGFLSNSR